MSHLSDREQQNRTLIIMSFTEAGSLWNVRFCKAFSREAHGFAPRRIVGRYENLSEIPTNREQWIGSLWGKADFLFIGAVGIAFRMTAPFVKDKFTDSAVVSMDEKGEYVIPLLSGHLGGGVELAKEVAQVTGGIPVITTATDVRERFAADVFARAYNLAIRDRGIAKSISAGVLENETVGIWVEPSLAGWMKGWKNTLQNYPEVHFPVSFEELKNYQHQIAVTAEEGMKEGILYLQPKNLVVGIGCRKGTTEEVLKRGIGKTFARLDLKEDRIGAIVSIDLKAEEEGLRALCLNYRVPLITYSAEELATTGKVSLESEFVRRVTGVDNVCERAVKYFLKDKEISSLLQEKQRLEGMTIAIGSWK